MSEINPEFVERYQILYDRDPKSKVFAPLAEAYRKMGLTNKSFLICKEGLKHHPNFAGGHIALARALIDLHEPLKAIEHIEKATELAPENILAYNLLAETHLHLKRPKQALKAFKMVLFFNPENAKAQKAVKKLESLTADEFTADLFANDKAHQASPVPKNKTERLDRWLSLIDAYLARNDIDRAKENLEEARHEFAEHPEVIKRIQLIQSRSKYHANHDQKRSSPQPLRQQEIYEQKIKALRQMLFNISNLRQDVIGE